MAGACKIMNIFIPIHGIYTHIHEYFRDFGSTLQPYINGFLVFSCSKALKNSFSNKTAYYDVGSCQLDTSVRHRRRFIIRGYFWWFSLKLPLFCYIHPLRMQSIRFPLSPPYILLMQHKLRSHNMYWHCYTAREYHIHYIQALNWAFSAKDSTLLRKAT